MRAKIYLCALLALQAVLMAGSFGQIADFDKNGQDSTESSESAVVLGSSGESQGLLPTTSRINFRTETGWSNWFPLKGVSVTTPPAAISPRDGVIDVFVGANQKDLWHIRHYGAWSEWERLFGPPPYNMDSEGVLFREYDLAAVYAGSMTDEEDYYFFTWGPKGNCLYKRCWECDGGVACEWEDDWIEIDEEISSRPASVLVSDRIYLFALDPSGWLVCNEAEFDDGDLDWDGWTSLDGPFASAPTAVSDEDTIHIFILNEDDEIVHLIWSTETDEMDSETIDCTDCEVKFSPAATISKDRIDLFGVEDDNLMHTWFDGDSWQDWEDLMGRSVEGQIAAISDGTGKIWVFAQGKDVERLWGIRYGPE